MVRRLKVPPHVALVAVLEFAVEAEEDADPGSNSEKNVENCLENEF